MTKDEQIKGMANPNGGSVGVQEARPELNDAIVQTLLPKLYSIIDRLLDGQDKALVIEARRVLPKAYKNSFEKGKGV